MTDDNDLYNFVSFNCKNVKRSVEDIRQLCRTSHIIALQEHWLLPHDIDFLNCIDEDFAYTGISAVDTSAGMLRGRPYGGVALLWRKSVFQNVSIVSCENTRLCAIKIVLGQRSLLVLSVYMPTDSVDNLTQFTDCLGALNGIVVNEGIESVYMLGDFNAHPGEPFYYELGNFCSDLNWYCADVEKLGLSSETFTYVSDINGCMSWLDHCVITAAALPTVHNVYVRYGPVVSDHFPLVIQCNLNIVIPKIIGRTNNKTDSKVQWSARKPCEVETYYKLCNELLKDIDFPIEFRNCNNEICCNNLDHRRSIDIMYVDIRNALYKAAIGSCATVSHQRKIKHVSGWNDTVREAHRTARCKFKTWVMCGKPGRGNVWEEMRESRKVFKSRLKWSQNNRDRIKMDILAEQHSKHDFRSFWKHTANLSTKPGLPVSVSGLSDPKCIANMFRDHFIVKSPLGPSRDLAGFGHRERVANTMFMAKDVRKAIRSMSGGKSPGHDGLSIEHLKYAGPHLPRVLAMFYSLCVGHSYLPADMMRTVVVPIVKNKTGDISDHNNYRPISLATVMAKVLDSLLNAQLDRYLRIHDNQFGFRQGLSTETAILCLKQTVRYYTDRRTPVYACFLDLSRAFDLVCYDILWQKLHDISVPQDLIGIFKFWYLNQVNVVRWSGALSEPYRLECGVRQGGLTSPRLFNLYVNALIEELSGTRVGCHIDGVCLNNISYADDMVLLSASVCGMRRLLGICEGYARSHGLIYNARKSECLVFRSGGKGPSEIPPIALNGHSLNWVDQFKYLGHVVTSDLKDDMDIERERRALSVRANMVARRFARCTAKVKITLFKAFCTTFYTSSLWVSYTQKQYSAFRVQYNNAFRVLLGLPRRCSASGMFAESQVDCFYTTMRKRSASLARRLRASSNSILSLFVNRFDCQYVNHCYMVHVLTNKQLCNCKSVNNITNIDI
jgi:hypothetical protein